MSEAVFALGKKGGQTLEAMGIPGVTLERQVPRQLEHRLGINEIRVAAELVFDLTYFLAAWELPGAGWQEPVIPDAVFACCGRTYALEFDRGEESLKYFVRSKAEFYRRGLSGLPLAAVLIVADSDGRMRSLLAALGEASGPFVFSTLSLVRERGLAAAIFQRTSGGREERLF